MLHIHFTSSERFIQADFEITFSIKENIGHVPSYSEQIIDMLLLVR